MSRLFLSNKNLFLVALLTAFNMQAKADTSLGETIDCSDTNIHFVEQADWTAAERLEAMDKAFFDSVNRFELCNLSTQSSSESSPENAENQASGATSDASSESSDGSSEAQESNFNSVASPSISGTEIEPPPPPAYIADDSTIDETITASSGSSASNGTKPADIPDADNDDVVAAQIRRAAELEQDQVKKAKLWNEYRKYKGLPINDE
ncbi:hypothetical protein A9Q78_09790 [Methylophaga sp. 41_12_T18]|nr:hypothetical protein A9Q78_09790 [Methylophaga sp. 41_12_T18]